MRCWVLRVSIDSELSPVEASPTDESGSSPADASANRDAVELGKFCASNLSRLCSKFSMALLILREILLGLEGIEQKFTNQMNKDTMVLSVRRDT